MAKWPPPIFFMAELKRPTGRYQWPLLPFSIWRWMWLPRGRMSQPFSSMNQISPVPHLITAFIFSRLLMPRSAGKSEPLTTAALKLVKCLLPCLSSRPIGTVIFSSTRCEPLPTPLTCFGCASGSNLDRCPRASAHLPAWMAHRSPHRPSLAPVSGKIFGSPLALSSHGKHPSTELNNSEQPWHAAVVAAVVIVVVVSAA